MGHRYQTDMLNALNKGDLFKAMDTLGRAGKMDNANGAWAEWHAAEKVHNDALAAGADKAQADEAFKHATLDIITHHTHHTPGIGHLISSVAKGVGGFVSDAVKEAGKISKAIKKIPGLSALINTVVNIIPGVASVRSAISGIIDVAGSVIQASELLSAATKLIPPDALEGFKVGAGLMSQKGIPPEVFHAIQQTLPPNQQKGFDMAVSIAIGKARTKAPAHLTPIQQAAFYATHGMKQATPDMRASMMTSIAADPHAAVGAVYAAQQIQSQKLVKETFWRRILEALHLAPKPPANPAGPPPAHA